MSSFNFKEKIGYFQLLKIKRPNHFLCNHVLYSVFIAHYFFLHFLQYPYQADRSQYLHPKGKSHLMIVPCSLLFCASLVKLKLFIVNDDCMTWGNVLLYVLLWKRNIYLFMVHLLILYLKNKL